MKVIFLVSMLVLATEPFARTVLAQSPVAPASATLPTAAPGSSEVEALVGQLSGDDWNTRRRAQERLVTFGDEVVPRLEQVLRDTHDAEARTRAEAALKQIEIDRTTGPTRLTLDLNNVTPADAFGAIAKQARCRFDPQPPALFAGLAQTPVSVDVKRELFWKTALPVCKATGLWFTSDDALAGFGAGLQIREAETEELKRPTFVSGPFLVVATNVNRSHSVQLSAPADVTRDFSVSLQIFPEPKLRVLSGSYVAKVEQAVDENGTSLVPPSDPNNTTDDLADGSQWPWDCVVTLQEPEHTGKRIAKLRGRARYLVQSASERAVLKDVLHTKNQRAELAGGRFVVESVTKNDAGDQYVVQVSVEQRQMSAERWQRLNNGFLTRWYHLTDARDRPLVTTDHSSEPVEIGGNKQTHRILFAVHNPGATDADQPGEPASLRIEIPTETRVLDVPFEFNDLPIP